MPNAPGAPWQKPDAREKNQSLTHRQRLHRRAAARLAEDRISAAWLSVVLLLHGIALALVCDPIHVLLGNSPLIDQDWGLHFHHLKSLEAFWREGSRLCGLQPLFHGRLSIEHDSRSRASNFSNSLPWDSRPSDYRRSNGSRSSPSWPWRAYQGSAILPARNCFYDHDSRDWIGVSAAALGTLYWWNSLPREMFFYGMVGFPVAAYFSVWGASLFYRLVMESPKPGRLHVGWLLFAAVILPLHVQSLVIFVPSMIALLIVQATTNCRNTVFLAGCSAGALRPGKLHMAHNRVQSPSRRRFVSHRRAAAAVCQQRSVDVLDRLSRRQGVLDVSSIVCRKRLSPHAVDFGRAWNH